MRVVLSLAAEREALARSRRNLLLAGVLALAAAFGASVFLSRGLVQPILEIQQVAQRIGMGDLTVRIRSDRRDELGDVARAVAAMVEGLRATVGRVTQAADGVEGTAAGIAKVTERLASVTAEQVAGNAVAVANMDRITDQMEGIAETAGAFGAGPRPRGRRLVDLVSRARDASAKSSRATRRSSRRAPRRSPTRSSG